MSTGTTALEIASVSAALRSVLANGLIRYAGVTGLGDVTVSVLPPDRITVGTDEPNQLNLFLYRVTPHSALRTARGGISSAGLTPRTVAFDLHYLVTAYGAEDYSCEILLGSAVHILSATPVLKRELRRAPLQPPRGRSRSSAAVATVDVVSDVREVKITPQFLTVEDLSKLWSALQARYRPSMAYEVSEVVMSLEA